MRSIRRCYKRIGKANLAVSLDEQCFNVKEFVNGATFF